MFIVVLGYLYVILMVAITAPSMLDGVVTFMLYGLAPVALLVYVLGRRRARRIRRIDGKNGEGSDDAKTQRD